jgi:dienelactone hydrolase
MARLRLIGTLTATGMLIALVSPVQHASTQTAQGDLGTHAGASIAEAEAPPGTETLVVQWVKVAAPSLGVMLAAVARPRGPGPFPTVVLLHGTHGFAHEYVRLAQDLASGGVLAVAACWFRGSAGSGTRFVTPIACPDAPPMSPPSSPEALQALIALVQAARTMPGAHPDRVGLFGHSRGGAPILNYIGRSGTVQAAILNSAGYPADLSPDVKAPILILHGTADSPAEGAESR